MNALNRVIGVGFSHTSNGRCCAAHPSGCGQAQILGRDDSGEGVELILVYIEDRHELPLYTINEDGSCGCRVGFAARQYATQTNGPMYDGALVRIMEMFTTDPEKTDNPAKHELAHRNFGYAIMDVIELAYN